MYSSPIYNGRDSLRRNRFYLTVRGGYGPTLGWKKGADDPYGIIANGVIGIYLGNNFRLDAEAAYHTKDSLWRDKEGGAEAKVEYEQYDYGINAYYDIQLGHSRLKPFLGVGGWIVSSRKVADEDFSVSATEDKTNFAVSGAAGLSYEVSNWFTLEAMGRGRYIFCKCGLYNIEALLGARFSF